MTATKTRTISNRLVAGALTATLILGMGAGSAWADGTHGDTSGYGHQHQGMASHHGQSGHVLRRLLKHQKALGLTDQQVATLNTLSLDLDRTRIKTEADILLAERELSALVQDEQADLAAIESKIKESEALEAGLRVAAIKAERAALALLTQEQRAKEQEERAKRMRQHHDS